MKKGVQVTGSELHPEAIVKSNYIAMSVFVNEIIKDNELLLDTNRYHPMSVPSIEQKISILVKILVENIDTGIGSRRIAYLLCLMTN